MLQELCIPLSLLILLGWSLLWITSLTLLVYQWGQGHFPIWNKVTFIDYDPHCTGTPIKYKKNTRKWNHCFFCMCGLFHPNVGSSMVVLIHAKLHCVVDNGGHRWIHDYQQVWTTWRTYISESSHFVCCQCESISHWFWGKIADWKTIGNYNQANSDL